MKVVSVSGSFLKVELDSGEVGFVPSIMVEDPNAAPVIGIENPYGDLPLDGEFEPLPDIPPGGNPPAEALPAVIDPTAPDANPADPGLDTIPKLPTAEESIPDPVVPPSPDTNDE